VVRRDHPRCSCSGCPAPPTPALLGRRRRLNRSDRRGPDGAHETARRAAVILEPRRRLRRRDIGRRDFSNRDYRKQSRLPGRDCVLRRRGVHGVGHRASQMDLQHGHAAHRRQRQHRIAVRRAWHTFQRIPPLRERRKILDFEDRPAVPVSARRRPPSRFAWDAAGTLAFQCCNQ
jgi:hypothetical protein